MFLKFSFAVSISVLLNYNPIRGISYIIWNVLRIIIYYIYILHIMYIFDLQKPYKIALT